MTDALQMCTYNLSAVMQHLRELRTKSKVPDETDGSQMIRQLNEARQCLIILSKAQQHRVHAFQDITMAEDSLSTAVSTIGDLIRMRGLDLGSRTINIMGRMDDETLQQISPGDWCATIGPSASRKEASATF